MSLSYGGEKSNTLLKIGKYIVLENKEVELVMSGIPSALKFYRYL